MSFIYNGREYKNPGVYQQLRVISGNGVADTNFKVPVILVSAMKGIPWNAGDGQDPIRQFENTYDVGKFYGFDGESTDRSDAFGLAQMYFKGIQNGGVPRSPYFINMRPITNCENISLDAGKLIVNARTYGPEYNIWTLGASVAAGKCTVTITPAKNVRFLTADAADTDTTVSVDQSSPYKQSDTVYLYEADGVGAVKSSALTVSVVTDKALTFDSAIGAGPGGVGDTSWQTGNGVFIYQLDTDNAIVSDEFDATYDNLAEYLEATGYFYVDDTNSTYTPGEAFTTIAEADWESFITAETDKALADTAISNTDVVTGLPALVNWLEPHVLGNKKLRFFTISMADCADIVDVVERMEVFKDFAYDLAIGDEYRTFWYGGNLKETTDFTKSFPSTADTDLTHPGNVAFRLGTQYFQYCATKNDSVLKGIDGRKGYFFAAYAMGEEMGWGSTFHNQTLERVRANVVNPFNKSEQKSLNDAGVTHIVELNTATLKGYYIGMGINTYRSRLSGSAEERWDEVTGEVGYPHAIHIVAHFEQLIRDELIRIIPNDRSQGKTGPVRAGALRAGRSFVRQEYFLGSEDGETLPYTINLVEVLPGAIRLEHTFRVRGVTNFIHVTNNVVAA